MIRNYLFDIGNVILKFDFTLVASRIAPFCEVDESLILSSLEPLHRDLETGAMSSAAFVDEAVRRLGYSGPPDTLRQAFQDIFTLNQPIVSGIEALDAEGQPLFLLSNTSELHVSWFTREYQVFDRFHNAVYSHEAGCMKPDPEIFSIARNQLEITPEETLYIDDLPANVEAAAKAGFCAFLYDHQDHADFCDRVRTTHGDNALIG